MRGRGVGVVSLYHVTIAVPVTAPGTEDYQRLLVRDVVTRQGFHVLEVTAMVQDQRALAARICTEHGLRVVDVVEAPLEGEPEQQDPRRHPGALR